VHWQSGSQSSTAILNWNEEISVTLCASLYLIFTRKNTISWFWTSKPYFGNNVQLIISYNASYFQKITFLNIQSSHLKSIKHGKIQTEPRNTAVFIKDNNS